MFALTVRTSGAKSGEIEEPCAVFETHSEAQEFYREEFAFLEGAWPVITRCPCEGFLAFSDGKLRGKCGLVVAAPEGRIPVCPHHPAE